MEFKEFALAVSLQIEKMDQHQLFRVSTDKNKLWEHYLKSFPPGSNLVFRERTEHDCSTCKNFIRGAGNIVAIIDGQMVTVWDNCDEIEEPYLTVSKAMAEFVKGHAISNIFLTTKGRYGAEVTHEASDAPHVINWHHFTIKVSKANLVTGNELGTKLSEARAHFEVLSRSIHEISVDALDTIIELIDQNSLYRGEENLFAIKAFRALKDESQKHEPGKPFARFCWLQSLLQPASVSKIRNTAIGTLLIDLSEGMSLDGAVAKFEAMVAPTNYKRPTALITKSMIEKAQKEIKELGFTGSLERRYAVLEDITINNVLHANRDAKKAMDVFDKMAEETNIHMQSLEKVEEIGINMFMRTVVPQASSLQLLVENRHASNLVSLIAPVNPAAPTMFKWDNNFCWSYAGEVADSMKERVKAAGGAIDGDLRFSIQWNDEQGTHNRSDYDAHCQQPIGGTIHYPSASIRFPSSGVLDVDITQPRSGKPAVENITFSDRNKMPEGDYVFLVHNFAKRAGCTGFAAEIEFDGQIHSFEYRKGIASNTKIQVAIVNYSKTNGFSIKTALPSSTSSKEMWDVHTQTFEDVLVLMNSPNHWDQQKTGNKHYFFMLKSCKQKGPTRGFYNEFLNAELSKHRKVFEVLGSKLKAPESNNQLSGLGFSSTQRNHVYCKVTGGFNRIVKILF